MAETVTAQEVEQLHWKMPLTITLKMAYDAVVERR